MFRLFRIRSVRSARDIKRNWLQLFSRGVSGLPEETDGTGHSVPGSRVSTDRGLGEEGQPRAMQEGFKIPSK